ncbi:MAG: transcriptional repressor [Desulfobacterota bacterium]|nr:transcriptional repressor [Thermodesulfobacteriota bacterium]
MAKEVLKTISSEKRLRMSRPRLFVFEELSASKAPLSPLEVYRGLLKKRRRVGLTSVYRCLDLFESLGIVFRIVEGSSVRYKFCETEQHHHHVVCKGCGEVVDIELCEISDWSKRVAETTGYEVTDHELNFYGFCQACKGPPQAQG